MPGTISSNRRKVARGYREFPGGDVPQGGQPGLKRTSADKTLEADFFAGALRTVKARSQRSGDSGGTASTPTS